jgi:PKD repeat protein
MKKLALFLILFLSFSLSPIHAQDWVQKMQDPTVNFYDVQKSFNTYWQKNEKKSFLYKLVGWKESQAAEENYEKYKRWENFTEPRVYPSGDRSVLNRATAEFQKNNSTMRLGANPGVAMAANWTELGPTTQISAYGGGAGRLNCVRFDPSNPSTIYVGAPAGGLWKSVNGGATWSTNTDKLAVIGISDVAVDPTNPSILYIATGDGDAGDTYSNGVLKSTDGGLTWLATGLNFTISDTRKTYRLVINPTNPLMLLAGTSSGLFKTMDGGVTWTKSTSFATRDIEFKPGDPTVVYAVSNGNFYRSVNSGSTFSIVTANLPASTAVVRLAIAVTAADPNYVYLVAANATSYNFRGLYRSTDQGLTFTTQSTSPNLLGFNTNGGDAGGQGWYTLSIAASPTNKNEVIVGGVNVWRSTSGGASWSNISSWTGFGGPYVHADIHDLNYLPGSGSTFFASCDGGFFKTTNSGSSWQDLSNGLRIGQMYRLGCAQTDPNIVIQGWQDNGTSLYNLNTSPVWQQVYGGDGMDCFIDYSNANNMYCETYNGNLQFSNNGGSSFSGIIGNITGNGAWITPWDIDPVTPTTIYAGFNDVWKSIDQGSNWTQISNINGGSLTNLEIAHSNPKYIYTGGPSNLYGTTDGGVTWANLTPTLPGSGTMTKVAISTTDPKTIWITYSGFNANTKVFKSKDGGHTWKNLSASLPNVPVNCAVNQPGTAEGVYIGTDVGVYYTDTTMTSWTFFSNGLPNVVVDELEIQTSSKKLRAATYGRGLWETPLYNPASTLPLANFNSDIQTGCPGMSVTFTDLSSNSPTGWNWVFAGGTPATSTAQNPVVVFNNPGSFNLVKLTVTNANGSDSVTKYSYIGVSPKSPPTITRNGKDTICAGDPLTLVSSFGNNYTWSTGQTNPAIAPIVTGTYTVAITDGFGCVVHSAPMSIVINPLPNPIITVHGDTLVSNYTGGNQWYFGSNPIPGATAQMHVESGTGGYSVHVTDANGCKGVSNSILGIPEDHALANSIQLYPNPSTGHFTLKLNVSDGAVYTVRICDVTGRELQSLQIAGGLSSEKDMDLSGYGKGNYLLEVSGPKGKAVKRVSVY